MFYNLLSHTILTLTYVILYYFGCNYILQTSVKLTINKELMSIILMSRNIFVYVIGVDKVLGVHQYEHTIKPGPVKQTWNK